MTLVKSKIRQKPTASERKRTGQHHKRSQHYNKTYWPYLPIILIFALGLLINNSLNHHGSKVLGATSNFSSQSLLASTNAQRLSYKESPLSLNAQLNQAAQAKAEAMVAQNFWSHDSPSGQTPWSYIASAGYSYSQAGENLAYGFNSASDTVTGWMNSTEHRANILNTNYQNVGFGVASSPNYVGSGPETVVVAEYADPVSTGEAAIAPASSSVFVGGAKAPASLVARVQLLTGGKAIWSLSALSVLTLLVASWFIVRHTRRFKKIIIDGEHLAREYYMLDIVLAVVITVGFILTRSSGVIR